MALTSQASAVSLFSSTSILTKMQSSNSSAIFTNLGPICWQGPHHEAVKSITMSLLPWEEISWSKSAFVRTYFTAPGAEINTRIVRPVTAPNIEQISDSGGRTSLADSERMKDAARTDGRKLTVRGDDDCLEKEKGFSDQGISWQNLCVSNHCSHTLCTLCLASPKWKNFWTGLRDMTILPSTTQVLAPVMRSLFVMPNQTRRMVHEELAATSLAISAF